MRRPKQLGRPIAVVTADPVGQDIGGYDISSSAVVESPGSDDHLEIFGLFFWHRRWLEPLSHMLGPVSGAPA
ncbi:hypothetical protein GCM10027569_13440 [Flindersiella endophytica]